MLDDFADADWTDRPQAYRLTRLTLSDFRSYAALRLDLGPDPVVLTGANGAGKTNILEAISMLTPGRGLRRAPIERLARQDGSGASAGDWAVSAEINGPDGALRLASGIDPNNGQRAARVNAAATPVGALAGHLRLLWLTPANDGLFTGPSGDRRRFLDRFVTMLDPAHGGRLAALDKLLRQRNRLLEDHASDARWLHAIEADLAAQATAIAAARVAAAQALARDVGHDRRGASSAFPFAGFELSGHLEDALANASMSVVEHDYADRLAEARPRDRAAGRTLDGPHRSDFAVTHGPKAMPAPLCSTGEQKALLIALILAQARIVTDRAGGYAPVLLLDEIAAHLDDVRRGALFDEIVNLGCQAWLTGTDRTLFSAIEDRAQCFEVGAGRVSAWH